MVDYHKSTGSSGTMRIRDNGSTIEFWITSGNSSTYAYDMPWAYVINGVSSSWREFRYEAGDGYQRLGTWTVTSTQTVTFKLGDTGTSGLGGPTNFSVTINRAKPPSPPSIVTLSNITSTSMHATFTDGAANGAAITSRFIGYGTSSTSIQTTVPSDRSTDITGLLPGTTYYFWAWTQNSEGSSGFGPRGSATTRRVPYPPTGLVASNIKQTEVDISFTDGANGGSAITSRQIAYNTANTLTGATIVPAAGTTTLFGLSPGITHYIWARATNAIGNGDWSTSLAVTLVAGAYIKVGPTWKRAVPYIRVGGTWYVARSWARTAGVWKETK